MATVIVTKVRPFTAGLMGLATLQAHLGKPPKKKEIPALVDKIVKAAGLKGTGAEGYFRLLAICALKNQEQRFRNWKPIRRKK